MTGPGNESIQAARAKRIKLYLEIAALLGALAAAVIFSSRRWPVPTASLSAESISRSPYTDQTRDVLVVRTSLVVGDSSIKLEGIETTCTVGNAPCSGECGSFVDDLLSGGTIGSQESIYWDCLWHVPPDRCARVSTLVSGSAAGFAFGDSHWRTQLISCPEPEN